MPKRSSKEHDFVVNAFRIVEKAIGEHMDGTPLSDPNAGKMPQAIARGQKGGKRGGVARASALSAEKRKEIAIRAAKARWSRTQQ